MTGPSKQTANPPDTAPEQPLYRGLYRGRFAPSPTGPLHFGSVVAALASYLDARAQQGRWLLRIDDLDAARNVPGAADGFLHDLERLGLHWDETPVLQSRHRPRYHEALDALRTAGIAYPCGCSRKALVAGRYPGTCATGLPSGTQARALRVRTLDQIISFDDLIQGRHAQNIHATLGDFVVLRADGAVAYHLATVIDDAAAGISRVLRGADLLDSTPRQIHLQGLLGLPTPEYAHVCVAVNDRQQKLSKQTFAAPVSRWPASRVLSAVLGFLDMSPPKALQRAPVEELLAWAITAWRLERLPRTFSRVLPAQLTS